MALQIWLPLNGDLTNQGLNDVIVTNNGVTVDNNGKIGKCYRFDGDVYLNLSKGMDTTKDYSICYWVKEFENNTLGQFRVVYQCGGLIVGQYGTYLNIYNGSGSGLDVTAAIDTTTWHHACFTFQSSENLVTIYIDGKYATSKTVTSIPTSSSSAVMGKRSSGTYLFQGTLNDFRIYDHCLSPKEVQELAKGLVLHYRLAGPGQPNLLNGNIHLASAWTPENHTVVNYSDSNFTGLKITATQANGRIYNSVSNLWITNNAKYTVSFWAKSDTAGTTIDCSRSIADFSQTFTLSTNWKYYSGIITTTQTSVSGTLSIRINQASRVVYIANIKVENGAIATPFVPPSNSSIYSAMGYNNNIEYDCSGFGNNGTKSGAEIVWDINSPRYTTSYKFNGSGQKISVAKKIVPQLTNATFSVWFYRSDYGTQSWESLITIQNDPVNNVNNYFEIETKYSTTNNTEIRVYNGTGTPVIKTNAYELNKWTHVAVTLNPTQIKLYINGELVSTGTSHALPDKANYCIGSYTSGSQSFKGNISDVRIYVTELSAEDIAELYHSAVIIDNTGKSYAYEYFEA